MYICIFLRSICPTMLHLGAAAQWQTLPTIYKTSAIVVHAPGSSQQWYQHHVSKSHKCTGSSHMRCNPSLQRLHLHAANLRQFPTPEIHIWCCHDSFQTQKFSLCSAFQGDEECCHMDLHRLTNHHPTFWPCAKHSDPQVLLSPVLQVQGWVLHKAPKHS